MPTQFDDKYDLFAEDQFADKGLKKIITTQELKKAWGGANFGYDNPRDVVKKTLIDYMAGYSTGHLATKICVDLGLLTKVKYNLTKKGKRYLHEAVS